MYYLNDYKDLYKKCEYDLSLLKDNESSQYYNYNIFNLLCSLNHLYEWFLLDTENEVTEDIKIECIKLLLPLEINCYHFTNVISKLYNTIKKKKIHCEVNPYCSLIREVCNKLKHYKSTPIIEDNIKYTYPCGDVNDGGCGSGRYSGEHNLVPFVDIVINNITSEIPVKELCEKVLYHWTIFFNQYNLLPPTLETP